MLVVFQGSCHESRFQLRFLNSEHTSGTLQGPISVDSQTLDASRSDFSQAHSYRGNIKRKPRLKGCQTVVPRTAKRCVGSSAPVVWIDLPVKCADTVEIKPWVFRLDICQMSNENRVGKWIAGKQREEFSYGASLFLSEHFHTLLSEIILLNGSKL